MAKKYKWINDDVKLDFHMCKSLQYLCRDAEKYDLARDRQYFNCAEAIDLSGKNMFVEGKITKQQWRDMNNRYPDVSMVSDEDY